MGLKPEDCLAVEDSENGVLSAVAAGLPVLVIESEYSTDHDLSAAALIVDEWGTVEQPMKVISGNAHGSNVITLDLMRSIHDRTTDSE